MFDRLYQMREREGIWIIPRVFEFFARSEISEI